MEKLKAYGAKAIAALRRLNAAARTRTGKASICVGALAVIFTLLMVLNIADPAPPPPPPPANDEIFGRAEDPLVAVLNDAHPIYLSDLEREALLEGRDPSALDLASAATRHLLDEVIDQRLLAMRAEAEGVDASEEAEARIDAARRRILASIALEREVDGVVTDAAVREAYDEQVALLRLGEEVRARQILLRTEAEAQEARERAVVGEDFAALAEALSIDSATRRRGGDLGYFAADAGDPQISRAAFRTRVGEVSEPFETEEGWRIVKVLDRRSARPPSFSSRAEEIEAYLVLQAVRDVIRDLRRDADIEIFNLGPAPRRTADEDASPADAPAPALKGLTQPAEISQETASDAPKAPKPATAEGESPAED